MYTREPPIEIAANVAKALELELDDEQLIVRSASVRDITFKLELVGLEENRLGTIVCARSRGYVLPFFRCLREFLSNTLSRVPY